jgi:hypothetical protein
MYRVSGMKEEYIKINICLSTKNSPSPIEFPKLWLKVETILYLYVPR